MPQGPAHAVRSPVVMAPHCVGPSTPGGTAGVDAAAGWPDSSLAMSSFGPWGPNTLGVWQSWQPPMATRYLPRSTAEFLAGLAGVWAAVWATAFSAMPAR